MPFRIISSKFTPGFLRELLSCLLIFVSAFQYPALWSLNSNLTPVRINIKANISGISAYRIGRIVYVFMENMSRPAWSGGYIVEGLPNPIGKYVVDGFAGTLFTVGDGKIYADKYDANRWESFATVYMTSEQFSQ